MNHTDKNNAPPHLASASRTLKTGPLISTLPSSHRIFSAEEWANLRADTPMTVSKEEICKLQSLNDPVSFKEVERIYLPLSRLLAFHVEARQKLYEATARFLNLTDQKVPFIIGLSGSVSVGKSTTARLLRALLAHWPSRPKVELIATDSFLYPNRVLEEKNLMHRKGFPESYDVAALLQFLSDIKAGKQPVKAPVYSHLIYDIVPNKLVSVSYPDILILEGLNVLQVRDLPEGGDATPFVSDYFDFSIYLDADEQLIRTWFKERFLQLRQTAFRDPESFFRQFADLPEPEALAEADKVWDDINRINLLENILPTRPRANLILRKGADHRIVEVALRRL